MKSTRIEIGICMLRGNQGYYRTIGVFTQPAQQLIKRETQNWKISIIYYQQCLSQCDGMAMGVVRFIGLLETGNSSSTNWL